LVDDPTSGNFIQNPIDSDLASAALATTAAFCSGSRCVTLQPSRHGQSHFKMLLTFFFRPGSLSRFGTSVEEEKGSGPLSRQRGLFCKLVGAKLGWMPRSQRADEKNRGSNHALIEATRSLHFPQEGDLRKRLRIFLRRACCVIPAHRFRNQLMPYSLAFRAPTDRRWRDMSNFLRWVNPGRIIYDCESEPHYHTCAARTCLPRPISRVFRVQDDSHFHVLCGNVERTQQRLNWSRAAEEMALGSSVPLGSAEWNFGHDCLSPWPWPAFGQTGFACQAKSLDEQEARWRFAGRIRRWESVLDAKIGWSRSRPSAGPRNPHSGYAKGPEKEAP